MKKYKYEKTVTHQAKQNFLMNNKEKHLLGGPMTACAITLSKINVTQGANGQTKKDVQADTRIASIA